MPPPTTAEFPTNELFTTATDGLESCRAKQLTAPPWLVRAVLLTKRLDAMSRRPPARMPPPLPLAVFDMKLEESTTMNPEEDMKIAPPPEEARLALNVHCTAQHSGNATREDGCHV
jgi:hypothetical protein